MEAVKQKKREELDRANQKEKERQVENFMFLRMIKLMIKTNKNLDDARSTLVAHKTFSL